MSAQAYTHANTHANTYTHSHTYTYTRWRRRWRRLVEVGGLSAVLEYAEAVRQAVREAGCGIYPPPRGYLQFQIRRLSHGYRLLSRLGLMDGLTAQEATKLARIAGQGYLLGEQFSVQTGLATTGLPAVQEWCGVLNVLVSAFDIVLDEGSGRTELITVMSRENLVRALDPESRAKVQIFDREAARDPGARFTIMVAEQLFAQCRSYAAASGRDAIWQRFADSVLDAYDAELATLESADGFDSAGREGILKRKNSLPAVMICLLVLHSNSARPAIPEKLVEVATLAGGLCGLMDDLTDLPEDLLTGNWNTLLVGADRGAMQPRRAPDDGSVLRGLIESGLPNKAASLLSERWGQTAVCAGEAMSSPDGFLQELRLWLCDWITADPDLAPSRPWIRLLDSAARAVGFLRSSQNNDGSFSTDASSAIDMTGSRQQDSVYIHSYVIHSLSTARHHFPGIEEALRSATRYVAENQEENGWWRFFGPAQPDPEPDVDDTSVCFAAMIRCSDDAEVWRARASRWIETLEPQRSESGLFKTWESDLWNYHCYDLPDAAVNANLLLLMGMVGEHNDRLIDFFKRTVETESYAHLNLYGVTPYALPYLISRCYHDGQVRFLKPVMPRLIMFLEAHQGADGAWGSELDTAMALVTMQNAGGGSDVISKGCEALISRQDADGGWSTGAFFRDMTPWYFGGRTLTTALCLEAFTRVISPT